VATKAHFLARTYLEGDAIIADARSATPCMLPETPGFIAAMDASGHRPRGGLASQHAARVPFKLVTHNVGNVGSAANVLFLAGERRFACPQAVFFLHPSSASLDGSFHPPSSPSTARTARLGRARAQIIEQRTSLSGRRSRRWWTVPARSTPRRPGRGHHPAVKDLQIPSGARVVKA
jgi:hypothetical protein